MSNHTFHTHSAFKSFQKCCLCCPCFCKSKIGFNLHSMSSLFMFIFATPGFTTAKLFKIPCCPYFGNVKIIQSKIPCQFYFWTLSIMLFFTADAFKFHN